MYAQLAGIGDVGDVDMYPTMTQAGISIADQTAMLPSTVDWSDPSAQVVMGDTLPTGDTYAGLPTTVQQIQQTYGIGVTTAPKTSTNLLLIAGAAVVVMMIARR